MSSQASDAAGSGQRSRHGLAALFLAWIVSVLAGFVLLLDYGAAPGAPADAPGRWPSTSLLAQSGSRPTLVMVAHPRCPCTRASLGELARLLTRAGDRLEARILFVQPVGQDRAFLESDLWNRAVSLLGPGVLADPGGVEAERFGARISGTTLVYSPEGDLLFAGGITPTRGHEGDNVGVRRILALVLGGIVDRDRSEVFGCRLASGPAPGGSPPVSILERLEFPDRDLTEPARGAGSRIAGNSDDACRAGHLRPLRRRETERPVSGQGRGGA